MSEFSQIACEVCRAKKRKVGIARGFRVTRSYAFALV